MEMQKVARQTNRQKDRQTDRQTDRHWADRHWTTGDLINSLDLSTQLNQKHNQGQKLTGNCQI